MSRKLLLILLSMGFTTWAAILLLPKLLPHSFESTLFGDQPFHFSKTLNLDDGHADYMNMEPQTSKQSTLDLLDQELRDILQRAETEPTHERILKVNMTCSELNLSYTQPGCFIGGNGRCLNEFLPIKPLDRLESLLNNDKLRISLQFRNALNYMASKIHGQYDLIIVSAVSSNHYLESQAMLKNLHVEIFPILTNFTLVVYDLGLSEDEHSEYQRKCRCTLIKFPFHRFPPHLRRLKCFGWKPVVISAHYSNAKFVMWMDASIRYHQSRGLLEAIEAANLYGVQQRRLFKFVRNPYRSLPSTFHFFGDTPCAHLAFTQAESNWGIYRCSPLVKMAVLDSWVGCGLQASCTCPAKKKLVMRCPTSSELGGWTLGMCLRPQSAVATILAKLYLDHYYAVVRTTADFMKILRGSKENYFETFSNKIN